MNKKVFTDLPMTLIDCETLEELHEILEIISNVFEGDITESMDCAGFPIFSKKKLDDMENIYSYDDKRVLTYNNIAHCWSIEERCKKCGEAVFHCLHDIGNVFVDKINELHNKTSKKYAEHKKKFEDLINEG